MISLKLVFKSKVIKIFLYTHTLEVICHKTKGQRDLEEEVLNCRSILSSVPKLDKLVVSREDLSASNSMEKKIRQHRANQSAQRNGLLTTDGKQPTSPSVLSCCGWWQGDVFSS